MTTGRALVCGAGVIGIVVGVGVLVDARLGVAFVCACVYGFLLYRRPEIAISIVILVAHNLFGFISEEALRLPGIFKLRDILLLSLFLPLFREAWKKSDLRRVLGSPTSKCIALLVALSVVVMLKTALEHNIDISYAVKDGRRYFYYSLFFAMVYHIKTPRQFRLLIGIITTLGVVYSLLIIVQALEGPSRIIFPAVSDDELSRWKVVPLDLGGVVVARSYISGFDLAMLAFGFTAYRAVFDRSGTRRILNCVTLGVIGLQIVLSFSRTYWIGVAAALVFSTVLLLREPRKILAVVGTVVAVVIVFEVAPLVLPVDIPPPSKLIVTRAENLQTDVVKKGGSFGWRLEDNAERIDLVRKHILLGVGFVHDETGIFRLGLQGRGLRTADSGILSLLTDMGVLGLVIVTALVGIVIHRAQWKLRCESDEIQKAALFGAVVYLVSSSVASVTWPAFVNIDTIVPTTVACGIVEIAFIIPRNEIPQR